MLSPSTEEVRELIDQFGIHPSIAEELLVPTERPKVDLYKGFIYLILHFPSIGESSQEIDFVVGKNFIVTARYNQNFDFHQFSKLFEVNSILDRSNMGDHAGFILFFILRHLYRSLLNRLTKISLTVSNIEREIFAGREREMVFALSVTARDLLNFKRTIRLHKDVLISLESAGVSIFGSDFQYYLKSLTGEYFKVESALLNDLETVFELRETNNSLVSTKQNEIMKILTIMAFVTFPLSLVASIFGMNTKSMPLVGTPYDFWIVVLIMLIMTGLMFIFFKFKKWL